MIMLVHSFTQDICPDKLICNGGLRYITITDSDYIIKKFDIYTNKKYLIKKIIITEGKHPNCNLEDQTFCIPDFLTTLELNKSTFQAIVEMFRIFNFESAYYLPWAAFEYQQLEKEM